MTPVWMRALAEEFWTEVRPAGGVVLIHTPTLWTDGDQMTLAWSPEDDLLSDEGETAFRLWAFGNESEDGCARFAAPPVEDAPGGLGVCHPDSVQAVFSLLRAMQAADRWLTERRGA